MPRQRAAIFDVDGTLIDSVSLHARAWQDAFRLFGHDIAFDTLRGQIGKGGDELMPVFLSPEEMRTQSEALNARRAEILKANYLPQIKPFLQVRALFERILRDDMRIALASSAKGDELAHYKRLAEIDDLLDAETSADDAERSKPHPDIFEAALARLQDIPPQNALVIGDTPYDAIAAAKAGVRTIGLLCGGWSAAELKEAGCIACYENPADLLARYDTSPLAQG